MNDRKRRQGANADWLTPDDSPRAKSTRQRAQRQEQVERKALGLPMPDTGETPDAQSAKQPEPPLYDPANPQAKQKAKFKAKTPRRNPPNPTMGQAFLKALERLRPKEHESIDTATATDAYDRDPRVAEFIGFEQAGLVFSLDSSGRVVSRKLPWPGEPAKGVSLAPSLVQLPLESQSDHWPSGSYPALPGLVIIYAETKGGKTTALDLIEQYLPLNRCQVVEPWDQVPWTVENESIKSYSSFDAALSSLVADAYAGGQRVGCIDSLRAPLFETTGAAGMNSVITRFFTNLTRLSNQLAEAGITIIATINPMYDDEAYLKTFKSLLSASTSTLITLDRVLYENNVAKLVGGTVSERPERILRRFELRANSGVSLQSRSVEEGQTDTINTPAPTEADLQRTRTARRLINALNNS